MRFLTIWNCFHRAQVFPIKECMYICAQSLMHHKWHRHCGNMTFKTVKKLTAVMSATFFPCSLVSAALIY